MSDVVSAISATFISCHHQTYLSHLHLYLFSLLLPWINDWYSTGTNFTCALDSNLNSRLLLLQVSLYSPDSSVLPLRLSILIGIKRCYYFSSPYRNKSLNPTSPSSYTPTSMLQFTIKFFQSLGYIHCF